MGCDVILLAKSVSLDDIIEQKATYAFQPQEWIILSKHLWIEWENYSEGHDALRNCLELLLHVWDKTGHAVFVCLWKSECVLPQRCSVSSDAHES